MSKILLCLLLVGCCLVAGACMFVNQPQFGHQSAESSFEAIANSSNYYDGEFHNLTPTSLLSDDSSTFSILMSDGYLVRTFFLFRAGIRTTSLQTTS